RPPKGDMPDPADQPAGCPFHPRCPIAVERCRTDRPALRPLDSVQVACHRAEDMRAASEDRAASNRGSASLR
ncbi:MAG TPA: oligopeptide/dipeptide ABC transporter ATP-binding protein, partial [Hyphomicrobiales bacterium]